jgi:hypothetical protein
MNNKNNKKLFLLSFIALFFIILSSYLINNKDMKFGSSSKAYMPSNETLLLQCLTKCINSLPATDTQFMKDVASAKCNLTCQRDISDINPIPDAPIIPTKIPPNGISNPIFGGTIVPTSRIQKPTIMPTMAPALRPYFSFKQPSVTSKLNQNFKVDAMFNTFKGAEITSIDMYIRYDSRKIEFVRSTYLNKIFDDVRVVSVTPNEIYIFGANATRNKVVNLTAKQVLATLEFKPKKEGQTILSFNCTQGYTNDSNIIRNDMNSSDIIDCSKNNKSTVNITLK